MIIFVIANNKGGVGKSELTKRLLLAFARMGKKATGIDLDGQANLSDDISARLGPDVTLNWAFRSITDVLEMRCDLTDAITTVTMPAGAFQMVMADGELDNTADDMTTRPLAIMVLKNAIEQSAAALGDIVLIDCPPNLGPLTYSAFIAAGRDGRVIVPARPDAKSTKGVERVAAKLVEIRQLLGAAPLIHGIVAGQVRETNTHRAGLALLQGTGERLLATIPLREGADADTELDAAYATLAADLLREVIL